ncbi:MAG TPA: hypothetical protein VGX78_07295 [Pirellulales bacterium]|jgi:hypothetical protein|nr:hypothetical protein [Pirellulales bacterium]
MPLTIERPAKMARPAPVVGDALELPAEKDDLPSRVVISPQADGRWVVAPDGEPGSAAAKGAITITIDAAFEHLCPPLTKGEFAALAGQIAALGRCKDPLLVWRRGGIFVLLDGHNRLWICLVLLRAGIPIPFTLEFQELADEEEARRAIREAQVARRNLSDLAEAYFRGKEYLALKGPQGGDHKRKSKGHNVTLIGPANAARPLAAKHEVAERTIKRDGELAMAVDLVVETCGRRAGDAILDREGRVTQNRVLWLADLEASEMRDAMDEYLEKGRFPKRSDDEEEEEDMIWLRTKPLSLAARHLYQFLGAARARQFIDELVKLCHPNGRPATKGPSPKKLARVLDGPRQPMAARRNRRPRSGPRDRRSKRANTNPQREQGIGSEEAGAKKGVTSYRREGKRGKRDSPNGASGNDQAQMTKHNDK